MSSSDLIQQVKESISVLDYLESIGVSLEKRGGSYKACCPLPNHDEKTPSFTIKESDPEKYHCFGCGGHGDVLNLYMEVNGVDFGGALDNLAKLAGVEKPVTIKESSAKKETKTLYGIAQEFYHEQLKKNPEASSIVEQRGISQDMVKLFGIGFAPKGWSNLKKHVREKSKFTPFATWNKLELFGRKDKEGGKPSYYDFIRERLVFPVRDHAGGVIGFTSRDITDNQAAKYLVSSDKENFPRGEWLFGAYEADQLGLSNEERFMVEGPTDSIAGLQCGMNFVATMGTEVSERICKWLVNNSRTLYLVFDGDAAGHKAINKTIKQILPHYSMYSDVKILPMPEGYDPDSYLQRYGKEGFDRLKASSRDILDWLVQDATMKLSAATTFKQKAEVLKEYRALTMVVGDRELGEVINAELTGIFSMPVNPNPDKALPIVKLYKQLLDNPVKALEWSPLLSRLEGKGCAKSVQKLSKVCQHLESLSSNAELTSDVVRSAYSNTFGFNDMYHALRLEASDDWEPTEKLSALILKEELRAINLKIQTGQETPVDISRLLKIAEQKVEPQVKRESRVETGIKKKTKTKPSL